MPVASTNHNAHRHKNIWKTRAENPMPKQKKCDPQNAKILSHLKSLDHNSPSRGMPSIAIQPNPFGPLSHASQLLAPGALLSPGRQAKQLAPEQFSEPLRRFFSEHLRIN